MHVCVAFRSGPLDCPLLAYCLQSSHCRPAGAVGASRALLRLAGWCEQGGRGAGNRHSLPAQLAKWLVACRLSSLLSPLAPSPRSPTYTPLTHRGVVPFRARVSSCCPRRARVLCSQKSPAFEAVLGDVPSLPFVLVVCAGPEWVGDAQAASRRTGIPVMLVDPLRGGEGHDITRPRVREDELRWLLCSRYSRAPVTTTLVSPEFPEFLCIEGGNPREERREF